MMKYKERFKEDENGGAVLHAPEVKPTTLKNLGVAVSLAAGLFGIMLLVAILITFGSIISQQRGFMIIGFIMLIISVVGKFIFNKLDKIEIAENHDNRK